MKLYEFKRDDPDGRSVSIWVNPDYVVCVTEWSRGAAINMVNGTVYALSPVPETIKVLTGHFDD